MPYIEPEKKKSEIVEMHPRSWGGQQVILGWWKLQGIVRPNRNGLLSQGLGTVPSTVRILSTWFS